MIADAGFAAGLLATMVATPSASGSERELADRLERIALEHGIATQRVGDSLVMRRGTSRGPRLWLLSHLDTVPIGGGWTKDPLGGAGWIEEPSRTVLYGRGANDAKISGAAMLAALIDLRDDELRGEVAVVLTACEETDNSGMTACLAAIGAPDAAICGEPTGLDVVVAQGGLAVLKATWRGISCHAAHANTVENVNALLVAARELAEIRSVIEVGDPHPLLGRTTVVPTQIRCGERHNVVPDVAEVVFDARLAPNVTADDVKLALERRLPSAEIEIRSKRLAAVDTPREHPVVRAALKAAGREKPIASRTLSDMAFLKGVPAVKCGPGQTARSHTPDEFVCRDELLAGVAFYRAAAPAILEALAEGSAA
jgi:acetylornithine deacetylase